MTYLSELRSSLVQAAHRQHAEAEQLSTQHALATRAAGGRGGRVRVPSAGIWRRSLHGGRAALASLALGLTGTAVGVVQIGAPLGPEPQLSSALTQTFESPQHGEPSP
jgi:hypothetical protein